MRIGGYDHDDNKYDCRSYYADPLYCSDRPAADSKQKQNTCHNTDSGKNNLQNDYVTTKLADKNDYWFHVKNAPGSHVVMRCADNEDDPPSRSFTECAMIALFYSSEKEKPQAAVDYTKIRYVKKPSGSKPGFVIYDKNYTAYVTADKDTVENLAK